MLSGVQVRLPGTSILAFAAMLSSGAAEVRAQELEPRAYSPNPTGANFVLLGYGHSNGDVVFDASLPFRNVEARINTTSLSYGRSFGLFGRSASGIIVMPYVWGSVQGDVGETFQRISGRGWPTCGDASR